MNGQDTVGEILLDGVAGDPRREPLSLLATAPGCGRPVDDHAADGVVQDASTRRFDRDCVEPEAVTVRAWPSAPSPVVVLLPLRGSHWGVSSVARVTRRRATWMKAPLRGRLRRANRWRSRMRDRPRARRRRWMPRRARTPQRPSKQEVALLRTHRCSPVRSTHSPASEGGAAMSRSRPPSSCAIA